MYYWKP